MTFPPRRLHRAGIVLNALRALREAALPLVLAFVTGIGTDGRSPQSALTLGAIGVVVATAVGYRRWQTTVWWVSDGAVHLRSGILSSDETVVPKRRVQSVDTTQGPIQRLFGVLALQVQTAGGRTAEIRLDAVTPRQVQELRSAVGLFPPAERDVERLSLSPRALLLGALTSPQLGVLLPIVAAGAAVGDDLIGQGLRQGWFERRPAGTALLATVGAVGAVAWLLSVLASVIAFHGFTIERDSDRLLIRRGLGRRRAASLPLARIHAVRIVEGVLRQPFGLASLRLEVAGYRNEPAAAQTLFPVVRRSEVDALLARFAPELAGALGELAPPPRRALRRYVLPSASVALLGGSVLALALPAAWPAAAALLIAGLAHGMSSYRAAGWRLESGRVVMRNRLISRQTIIAPVRRLQEHSVAQSMLQRRAALGNVALAVGSGRRAAMAHLDWSIARELFDELRAGVLAGGAARRGDVLSGSPRAPSAPAPADPPDPARLRVRSQEKP
jgi:putative membrane protein